MILEVDQFEYKAGNLYLTLTVPYSSLSVLTPEMVKLIVPMLNNVKIKEITKDDNLITVVARSSRYLKAIVSERKTAVSGWLSSSWI